MKLIGPGRADLEFCGIGPVKTTTIAPVKKLNPSKREFYLEKVEQLGI
ncbi:MAG: hypothetical protein KAR19_13335 [Bacteroidales bacterium]|nr:hypothetical protein [Bacteroidales bacterium]